MRLAFYALSLSPVDATDVVKRVLTESVDGGSPVTREVFGDDELGYVPGSAVSLSLQDFDAAGNGSMPSAPFAFTAEALDVTPPSQPAITGIRFIDFRDVPDA